MVASLSRCYFKIVISNPREDASYTLQLKNFLAFFFDTIC
jgi:hypothetical protein